MSYRYRLKRTVFLWNQYQEKESGSRLLLFWKKAGEGMANKKIGAYITLDGEKQFRSAVTACNKSLATMKSEMKLVEAQTAGSANTLEALEKKHDILSKTVDEQVKKQEALGEGLKHAKEDFERVGNQLESYRKKLDDAKSALEEMKNSSETTEDALNDQYAQVEQLEKIVSKGEETYQRAGNRVQEWQKQLNNAEAQTIRATKALNENATYMREAESAADGCAKSIDEFGKQTNHLADEITSTGNIIRANLTNTAVDAAKSLGSDLFRTAVQGTLELQDAQNQLQASTGQTREETAAYNAEMQKMYKAGYEESITGVANAMALVKQYTNETDPSKIREMAENGAALQDTFDMDLSESIRGADALMENMGLTAEEAFDYIAKGAQNGLNKSGELTDNLAEYSQLWGQAGFSAEEMFSILQNGLDSGAYNLDKVNDYVKEFGISLSDGRIEENINAFSGETQNLFHQWKNGEATTKQVFQSVISDLSNMENQQQALTIASNTWSSLGEDNAMKVITSLNNVNTTYKDVHGTMESIKDIKYDSVTNQWKVLGRTFQTDVATPMLKDFLPVAEKGIELLADNIEVVSAVAGTAGTAIGTMFVVKKSKELINDLKDTAKGIGSVITQVTAHTTATAAQTAATTSATAAQTGLNAAMSANPIGLVVTGITTLVTVAAMFSSAVDDTKTKTEELEEEADALREKVTTAAEELGESTSKIETSLSEVGAKGKVAEGLVSELGELEAQTSRTAEQQARMQSIVTQLNTIFPEMALSIDDTTGKLSMSRDEMESYIDTAIEMQKIQAVQEKMSESVEKLVDAEIAQAEASQKVSDAESQLKDIQEQRAEITAQTEENSRIAEEAEHAYAEALKEGKENADEQYEAALKQIETTTEYNGEVMSLSEALQKMAEDETALNEVHGEYKDSLNEANDAIDRANEAMAPYTEYLNGMTEATQGNTDALAQNTAEKERAAEQAQASIESAGQELEAYQSMSSAQQDLAVNITNSVLTMQENVQSALESQMNMFEEFDGGVQLSTSTLLANMQSQIDGITAWEQNLSTLADRGINQGLLQKLAEMGPSAAGYVQTFVSMSDAELQKANELWGQSIDIQNMTNDWGQQLLTSGATNIAGGMEGLNSVMQESGANTVMGLVQGMQAAQKQAEAAGSDLGVKTVESINTGLGCHSPSTKTTASGRNVDQGLANGINTGQTVVKAAAKTVSDAAVNTVSNSLRKERFENYGRNVTAGLTTGILAGRSSVITAVTKVATDAITAAKNTLEIHSPSHVFRGMGNNSMDSYALGVTEKESTVKKAVTSAVNFKETSGSIKTQRGNAFATAENYNMLKTIMKDALSGLSLNAYVDGRLLTRELSRLGVAFSVGV